MADRPIEIDLVATSQTGAVPSCSIVASGAVSQPEHEVGLRRPRPGAAHALLLDRIVGVADAGGVEHHHRIAVEIELHLDDVARGAGMRRDDRGLAPREVIQQRRLAGIRRTGDRDHQPFAQPFTPPLRRKDFFDLAPAAL